MFFNPFFYFILQMFWTVQIKIQTLHNFSMSWALHDHTTFIEVDYIHFKARSVSNISNLIRKWKLYFVFFWDQVQTGRLDVAWYNDCDRGVGKVKLLITFSLVCSYSVRCENFVCNCQVYWQSHADHWFSWFGLHSREIIKMFPDCSRYTVSLLPVFFQTVLN